ncbi:MAG TPA: hypothetical protein VLN58_02030 [Verrucomicrobiae bacterium]|nr:hypothetical protein [Verrucomicrobiae bacterium]
MAINEAPAPTYSTRADHTPFVSANPFYNDTADAFLPCSITDPRAQAGWLYRNGFIAWDTFRLVAAEIMRAEKAGR